ncbi:MAG: hypothetical protein AAB958_00030 [Patescibacteria group bacterium]
MKNVEPTLDALFDSPIRVRLLRLFLFSSDRNFDGKIVAEILNISFGLIKKHLEKLLTLRFIISKKLSGKQVFKINKNFIFYEELKELIAKASPASKEKMLERLKGLGGIKLALLSGIFLNLDNSRADLLLVGDKIKSSKFDRFLKELEAEVGKEINCSLMTTKEFYYRYNMYDRFVRDILDFKHEKLINKLRI